jgi:hypothetical protein
VGSRIFRLLSAVLAHLCTQHAATFATSTTTPTSTIITTTTEQRENFVPPRAARDIR